MSEPTNASPDGVRSGELDLDAIERTFRKAEEAARIEGGGTGYGVNPSQALALVAEVRRLRAALEVIAGDELDYFGRLRLTDAEHAVYVIARDALGRSDEPSPS